LDSSDFVSTEHAAQASKQASKQASESPEFRRIHSLALRAGKPLQNEPFRLPWFSRTFVLENIVQRHI
jgi:hypothetical protein